MEITEVRIKLMEDAGERLQAFCSITFDHGFVIRDLKIIEGTSGPFVAMPSRKLTAHCPQCHGKNHLRAAYCNQCGTRLREVQAAKDEDGRSKLYADIAHPINSTCREMIQDRVIRAFREEIERAKQPGYVSSYDDFEEDLVAPRGRPMSTQTKIEPGSSEPPRPHLTQPSSTKSAGTSIPSASTPQRPSFGAGVFERPGS